MNPSTPPKQVSSGEHIPDEVFSPTNRREDKSSESTVLDSSEIALPIETYLAIKDPFRVVYPFSFTRPYPLDSHPMASDAFDSEENVQQMYTILAKYHISLLKHDLRMRWRATTMDKRLSIIFYTDDNPTDQWKLVAKEVFEFVKEKIRPEGEFEVEIVDHRHSLLQFTFLGAEFFNESADRAFDTIEEDLSTKLWSLLQKDFVSLSLSYRGKLDYDLLHLPKPRPTIRLVVLPGCKHIWFNVVKTAQAIIHSGTFEFPLEILVGAIIDGGPEIPYGGTKGMVIERLTYQPVNGSSIGIVGDGERSGTAGGFVHYHDPTADKVKTCILTCYHCIQSNTKRIRQWTNQNGIGINGAKAPEGARLNVEFPSRVDLKTTRTARMKTYDSRKIRLSSATKSLESLIAKDPSLKGTPTVEKLEGNIKRYRDAVDTFETALKIIDNRRLNPIIGKTMIASGIQKDTINNNRMDWALIEVDEAYFGKNVLPPESSIDLKTMGGDGAGGYYESDNFVCNEITDPCGRTWVIKTGRTTGITFGETTRLSSCEWKAHPELGRTMEWRIEGITSDFVQPGDSGSFVFDRLGRLVGMITGMELGSGQYKIGLMTPMKWIMESIEAQTGGGFITIPHV